MAMIGARTQIGIKKTGVNVNVPNNDRAKLMYYLNSMASVLDLSSEAALRRLKDYEKHYLLNDEEEAALMALCVALSPDELIGKCIFPVPDDAMNDNNEFLELSATETQFLASSSVLIGGSQRKVAKIMTFKKAWIENNYINPMQRMLEKKQEAQRRAEEERRRRQNDGGCFIM